MFMERVRNFFNHTLEIFDRTYDTIAEGAQNIGDRLYEHSTSGMIVGFVISGSCLLAEAIDTYIGHDQYVSGKLTSAGAVAGGLVLMVSTALKTERNRH
jgi:hypothetical protein